MSLRTLSTVVAIAVSVASVKAQDAPQETFPAVPLAEKKFSYPDGIVSILPRCRCSSCAHRCLHAQPYQVDTDTNLIRGFQSGYNLCNTTTEGQDSKCQTSFFNSLDGELFVPHPFAFGLIFARVDFCLWAPMEPNSAIADTEGEEVAWCTKPGRGTRLIPEGTFTGLQYIKTPDYIQIVGFMDGTKINIKEGDFGGELDPHGADLVCVVRGLGVGA